jgi:hypothetical protein
MSDKKRVYCRIPRKPERKFPVGFPRGPARAIISTESKWVPGTVLTYCFLDKPANLAGGEADKKIAREGFDNWEKVGVNLTFKEIKDSSEAMVRIGFKGDDGYWSYVGREILNTHYLCNSCGLNGFSSDSKTPDCPNCKSKDVEVDPRTMNLDGNELTRDPRGSDVPTHEIGHTLGLPHEHQSPYGGIVWDKQAVYDYFKQPPNKWPKEMVDYNILDKLSKNDVEGSKWDPDSIMEYAFDKGLIKKPVKYKDGLEPAGGISAMDQKWIKYWYPTSVPSDEIKLDTPVKLNLKTGEAREFRFKPSETRLYDFQTFGESDTVMVLFEEKDGKRTQLDADDDSGENNNAHIHHDLKKGNNYILTIRMYWNYTKGDTTLKVW